MSGLSAIQQLKSEHPQYKDVPDLDLAHAVAQEYPEYRDLPGLVGSEAQAAAGKEKFWGKLGEIFSEQMTVGRKLEPGEKVKVPMTTTAKAAAYIGDPEVRAQRDESFRYLALRVPVIKKTQASRFVGDPLQFEEVERLTPAQAATAVETTDWPDIIRRFFPSLSETGELSGSEAAQFLGELGGMATEASVEPMTYIAMYAIGQATGKGVPAVVNKILEKAPPGLKRILLKEISLTDDFAAWWSKLKPVQRNKLAKLSDDEFAKAWTNTNREARNVFNTLPEARQKNILRFMKEMRGYKPGKFVPREAPPVPESFGQFPIARAGQAAGVSAPAAISPAAAKAAVPEAAPSAVPALQTAISAIETKIMKVAAPGDLLKVQMIASKQQLTDAQYLAELQKLEKAMEKKPAEIPAKKEPAKVKQVKAPKKKVAKGVVRTYPAPEGTTMKARTAAMTSDVNDAIAKASGDPKKSVAFSVEGGRVRIVDTKEALAAFKENVGKFISKAQGPVPTEPGVVKQTLKGATAKVDLLAPLADKNAFTDGTLLVKGKAPKGAKLKPDTGGKPIAKKLTDDILKSPTKPAEFVQYKWKSAEGEALSAKPIPRSVSGDAEPVVVFRSAAGDTEYSQPKFMMLKKFYPKATFGVSDNGMLVAYKGKTPVGALMTVKGKSFVPKGTTTVKPPKGTKLEGVSAAKAPTGTGAAAAAPQGGFGTIGNVPLVKKPKVRPRSQKVPGKRPAEEPTTITKAAMDRVLKSVSPAARSRMTRESARVLRTRLAEVAQRAEAAREGFKSAQRHFVTKSREEVFDFIDKMETGKPQPTTKLDEIALAMRGALDKRRNEIRALGKGKLETYYTNYFPHIWKDPNKAKTIVNRIFSKRTLAGPKGFMRQRAIVTVKEGVKEGLELVSDNPVDLVLLKLHEMDRYLMAENVIGDLKGRELVQFVYARAKAPEGYVRIDDSTFDVFMPPELTVKEAYDEVLVDSMIQFARSLGVQHQRLMKLKGKAWGLAFADRLVETKFAGPESVFAHEIGHAIGKRYAVYDVLRRKSEGVWKEITRGKRKGQQRWVPNPKAVEHRKIIETEWRALADARFEGRTPSKNFQSYVRQGVEKEAVLVESLVHAPDKFKEIAPTLFKEFKKFINDHAELRPLLDIKPSLVLGVSEGKLSVPGVTKLGSYYAPEPVGTLINNQLSPGLRNSTAYNLLRYGGNLLNQVQLSLSLFHMINTGLDSMASQLGLGLRKVLAVPGQKFSGFMDLITFPVRPAVNLWTGGKLIKNYRQELDLITDPVVKEQVEMVIRAGGRASLDPFYYNQGAERLIGSLQTMIRGTATEKLSTLVKLPMQAISAAIDTIAGPLMRYWVPRQKMGMFLKLAESEMMRAQTKGFKTGITPDTLHEMLTRAWDSVDNRMGQLVYDNIFWNKTLKDALMLSIRSVGWNVGSWREYAGALTDILGTSGRVKSGDVWLSNKTGYAFGTAFVYAVIGGVMTYLLTGEYPRELKDYYFPRTGNKNSDGSDERLSLPTYARDWWAYADNPTETVINKLHPSVRLLQESWENQDFYGTEIRAKDDPIVSKLLSEAEHWLKAFQPISVRSYKRLAETNGHDPFLAAATGITPAPRYLTRSPAQKMAYKYIADKMPSGARTKEQFEHVKSRAAVKKMLKNNQPIAKEGLPPLSFREWRKVILTAKMDPFVETFRMLSFRESLNVYIVSNPTERKKVSPFLALKFKRSDKSAYWFPEAAALYGQILKDEKNFRDGKR